MIINAIGPSVVRLEVELEPNLECIRSPFIRMEVTDRIQSKFVYLNKAQAKMLAIELMRLIEE